MQGDTRLERAVNAVKAVYEAQLFSEPNLEKIDSSLLSRDKRHAIRLLCQEKLQFVIERLVSEGSSIAEAARCRQEFLQFCILVMIYDQSIVPTMLADKFWHAFLMYTEEYQRFCGSYFGRFVHHRPTNSPSSAANDSSSKLKMSQVLETWF
jgi:hypothetical protein